MPQGTIEKAFGAVLRENRLKRGLSQEELSFRSGYDRSYISQLERGLKSPTLRVVFTLAKTLGTRAAHLVEAVESKAG